jgi:hypothetical protein
MAARVAESTHPGAVFKASTHGIAAAPRKRMPYFQAIDAAQLETITGGADAVTADNFMPRAKHLKALNEQNDAHPSAKLGAQIYNEFCGELYPYAKSDAPINGLGSTIARYMVKSKGNQICEKK